jgi:CDP-diacylglycerol--serine O-phosphatidyltransferase
LGHLLCGFGAIYCGLLSVQVEASELGGSALRTGLLSRMMPTYVAMGAYLLIVAMIFDGLDGRLARLTRKTSDFGAQLDSLADMVSFGVGPAVLVLCLVMPALGGHWHWLAGEKFFSRAAWVAVAVFVACAALRLARFNVENVHDESAHVSFRGIPTPGAAGALASLIILHEEVIRIETQWASGWLVAAMPVAAFGLGLLMVSSVRYVHPVNAYLRRRRPISHLVAIVIVVTVGVMHPQALLAGLVWAYVISGPAWGIWRRLTGRGKTPRHDTAEQNLPSPADEQGPAIRHG